MRTLSVTDSLEINVDVLILFDHWGKIVKKPNALCQELARQTHYVCQERCPKSKTPKIEISIVFAHDKFVRDLNFKYRNIDKPTNVLSFPNECMSSTNYRDHFEGTLLGDVVISYETIIKESENLTKPTINHSAHMIIHGLLHLFGFDHDTLSKATEMESFENKALAAVDFRKFL